MRVSVLLIAFIVLLAFGFYKRIFFYFALVSGVVKLGIVLWLWHKQQDGRDWEERYIHRQTKGVTKWDW